MSYLVLVVLNVVVVKIPLLLFLVLGFLVLDKLRPNLNDRCCKISADFAMMCCVNMSLPGCASDRLGPVRFYCF